LARKLLCNSPVDCYSRRLDGAKHLFCISKMQASLVTRSNQIE